jgi:N-acyl amino acid synthase of PEP-CTERM/exosortase system
MPNLATANTPCSQPGHNAHPSLLRSAMELRYQVYCLECHFLPQDDYPDGAETDEHDGQAEHFYAFDAPEKLAAYVRLIRPDDRQHLPLHEHCTLSLPPEELPDHRQAAEISRLMVRSDYRRQRGAERSNAKGGVDEAGVLGLLRQEAPEILLSLYRQMYAFSRAHDIRYWYAAMERPLARSLHRMHFAFRPIGPQVDYYGPVAPYLADLRELEAQLDKHHPLLLAWMQLPDR